MKKSIFMIIVLLGSINVLADNESLTESKQSRPELRKSLEDNNIIGIITEDNRILFYTQEGCDFYGKCQWCALQSSGDFEGWYECQGLKGAKIGSAIKETAVNAAEGTKKFAIKAGEAIRTTAVDIGDTTVDIARKTGQVAKRAGKKLVEGTRELAKDIGETFSTAPKVSEGQDIE